MELLRIIAMFLVMVSHANFWILSFPTTSDFAVSPLATLMRVLLETLSIVSVNVFVLISGWYGMKLRRTKLLSFIFQILFFNVLISVLSSLYAGKEIYVIDIVKASLLLDGSLWFVKAYLMLLILSPLLNIYIQNVERKQYKCLLISFFLFQSVYGWLFPYSTVWICNGYSVISFVALYLLARYIYIYRPSFSCNKRYMDFMGYIGLSVFILVLYVLLSNYNLELCRRLFMYSSPLVILSSLYLLFAFSKMQFKSLYINYVAASVFSVYLFHQNTVFEYIFRGDVLRIYNNHSGLYVILYTGSYLVLIYATSFAIDQIRRFCWRHIVNKQ
ncbi:acyltransferase family protein [Prevotella sp. kh1p2]|uniref:acyltransferase family protein n=1 Tax=Prevotella sp. kh1p2 TaxID=1761883 RepID=UPI0008ADC0CF|nr:Surface polysaccharide O-acyltransferase, integral membrane enzyme [Prevotella sp. kh1p2]SNU11842.1 Surface polysaccharide O-acyltransferase, integral membrane enzyme [Prevotellaceae bacterium KH2P17]